MAISSRLALCAPLGLLFLSGCTRDYKFQPVDMWNGSRLKPYEQVNFFDDKKASRTPPSGSVARGQLRTDEVLYYGTNNGTLVSGNPVFDGASAADKRAILQRGQERYNIYCQPCHGLNGSGDGLIIKRGFAAPPSYHIDRLKNAPDGHFFDVITNGYGSMYSYASRVPTRDRWAIVAYIRAQQLSQDAGGNAQAAALARQKGEKVVPPLENRMKWIGPGGGREYHGTGPGGAGEPGSNALGEEHGTTQSGIDTASSQATQNGASPAGESKNVPDNPSGREDRSNTSPERSSPAVGGAR